MLKAALESMPYGFSIWNADDQLLLFNQRYAEMYRFLPGTLRSGLTLAEACRLTREAGNHADLPLEEMIAIYSGRLAQARQGPSKASEKAPEKSNDKAPAKAAKPDARRRAADDDEDEDDGEEARPRKARPSTPAKAAQPSKDAKESRPSRPARK